MDQKKSFIRGLFKTKRSNCCNNVDEYNQLEHANSELKDTVHERNELSIKILGPGCRNCETLAKNVSNAVTELGLNASIEKITNILELTKYGVMSTPALVIDEQVVAYGKVLNTKEVKELLERRLI